MKPYVNLNDGGDRQWFKANLIIQRRLRHDGRLMGGRERENVGVLLAGIIKECRIGCDEAGSGWTEMNENVSASLSIPVESAATRRETSGASTITTA